MNRSLLKDNASLFVWLVRLFDPLLVDSGRAGLPIAGISHTWSPAGALRPRADRHRDALLCAVSARCGIYSPQRGVTLFEETRTAGERMAADRRRVVRLSLPVEIRQRLFARVVAVVDRVRPCRALDLPRRYPAGAARPAPPRLQPAPHRHRRRRTPGTRHRTPSRARRRGAACPCAAFYDDDPALAGTRVRAFAVRGPIDDLARDLAAEPVDQIWIALPLRAEARIRELLTQLRQHSVEVRLVPDIFNFVLLNHSMTEVAGLPVINLTESPLSGVNRVIKGVEDFVAVLARSRRSPRR